MLIAVDSNVLLDLAAEVEPVVDAALLGCGLFLTSDSHFLELDFKLVMLELKACNVSVPVIASPRELVRKFYR